jgi:hypothetical protein
VPLSTCFTSHHPAEHHTCFCSLPLVSTGVLHKRNALHLLLFTTCPAVLIALSPRLSGFPPGGKSTPQLPLRSHHQFSPSLSRSLSVWLFAPNLQSFSESFRLCPHPALLLRHPHGSQFGLALRLSVCLVLFSCRSTCRSTCS